MAARDTTADEQDIIGHSASRLFDTRDLSGFWLVIALDASTIRSSSSALLAKLYGRAAIMKRRPRVWVTAHAALLAQFAKLIPLYVVLLTHFSLSIIIEISFLERRPHRKRFNYARAADGARAEDILYMAACVPGRQVIHECGLMAAIY